MNGRAKEIYRDCYNLLESECGLDEFKEKSKGVVSKYEEVKDTMLCVELLGVVASHIMRRDRVIQ